MFQSVNELDTASGLSQFPEFHNVVKFIGKSVEYLFYDCQLKFAFCYNCSTFFARISSTCIPDAIW